MTGLASVLSLVNSDEGLDTLVVLFIPLVGNGVQTGPLVAGIVLIKGNLGVGLLSV